MAERLTMCDETKEEAEAALKEKTNEKRNFNMRCM